MGDALTVPLEEAFMSRTEEGKVRYQIPFFRDKKRGEKRPSLRDVGCTCLAFGRAFVTLVLGKKGRESGDDIPAAFG